MRVNYEQLRAAPYVTPFHVHRDPLRRLLRWTSRRLMRCLEANRADAILTERMAEVPEFVCRVRQAQPQTPILDAGCSESLMPLHYIAMGYEVDGVDLRDPGLNLRGFRFVQGDAATLVFGRTYDVITLLSVLEHCGFGHYGGVVSSDDTAVVTNLRRFLTPTGRFVVSVPFGRPKDLGWFRVYDRERLVGLFGALEHPRWYRFEAPTWYPCTEEEAAQVQTTQWALAIVVFESAASPPAGG